MDMCVEAQSAILDILRDKRSIIYKMMFQEYLSALKG